jgi:hypothetical protein
MQAHILAGHFSAGPQALFGALQSGSGALRITRFQADGDEGADLAELALSSWLAAVPRGEVRRAHGLARVHGSKELPLRCECFGAGPGRVFTSIECEHPLKSEGGITFKDVELALLGAACQALAHESQGAVLIGQQLGPVGAGLPRGTVAEEVLAALALHGAAVEQLVLAKDTAEHLSELTGFVRARLGNLVHCSRAV